MTVSSADGPEPGQDMTSEAIIAAGLSSAPRNALLRNRMFRKVYLILFILFALVFLLPYWTLLYIPRSNRPRHSWTLQRCLRVRWSRLLCALVARCEIDYLGRDLSVDLDPLQLTHSHPVTIPPAPPSHLIGHPSEMLRELHRVRGAWIPSMVHRANPSLPAAWGKWNDGDLKRRYGFEEVKGFWYSGKKERPDSTLPPRQAGDPVGIHFHGGGYLCGTAAETDLTSSIAKNLVIHSPIHHILAIDYRLAPSSPWPLPLLDAISAYAYLVHTENIPESDIVLIGDSAGGHLALALARWLRDTPLYAGPKGLVLLSPWVDIGFTTAWGEGKYYNADSDLIDDSFGPFATSLLLRALPQHLMHTSEYLSPASLLIPSSPATFAGFPPAYVVHGTAERLSTSINHFWDRLQSARRISQDKHVKGVDCVHDFMIFPWQSEEAAEVYADMDIWLRDLLSEEEKSLSQDQESTPVIPGNDPIRPPSPIVLHQRRLSRQSMRAGKSPHMGPVRPGVGSMMDDMRSEAMSYMDLPDLISPLVGQVEGIEWDWGEEAPGKWYDIEDCEQRNMQ